MPTQVILEPLSSEGSGVILAAFNDENGDPVTPDQASWSLIDKNGNIINYRKNVNISPLSTSASILLTRLDLRPDITQKFGVNQKRILRIKGSFTSSVFGPGIPINSDLEFYVENPPVIIGESLSLSPSASRSPSASGSPSASVSPSSSRSPSVSPSASASPSP
jgi:hypothetical protein